ncbi:saccharopine dehydrogenase NADP-binding domain-containing protein [Aurantimonas marina]|uniref:saccharopine dehydrogenase NADP-binding domain-containing protein n=1 Tax=Aurantimonas marina TaxID=2780508 RepID=UPI0019CFC407|nr:saccharopine dehydrogenase NADP-binding domain-containing protein [Aurantimonas marina]
MTTRQSTASTQTSFEDARIDRGSSDTPAKILLIGGYGQVGQLIAEQLAPGFPNRLVIAGRSLAKATACAARIGEGVTGRVLDVNSGNLGTQLDGVALVLVSVDQADTGFAKQCLSHGVDYLDVTAGYEFLRRVSSLDGLAKRNGATAALSVGVAPGLTNLMAAHAVKAMDRTDRIDVFIQLGLGDRHGKAAIGWMLDNLDAEYEVREAGRRLSVRGFAESRRVRFPGQRFASTAYRFNFSDQQVLPATLNVPSVSTWLCFDSRFLTWLLAVGVRAGLGRRMRQPHWRTVAIWLLRNMRIGSDICAVAVCLIGKSKQGTRAIEVSVVGRNEALMTAIVTAEIARQMLSGQFGPGVFHSEQIITVDSVVSALESQLSDLRVALDPFAGEHRDVGPDRLTGARGGSHTMSHQ